MKEIKKVIIVGGGSSAMLAAAYISNNTNYKITMVDKPGGSPIGVGEATLINFKPRKSAEASVATIAIFIYTPNKKILFLSQ